MHTYIGLRSYTAACIHVAGRARAQGLAHDERCLQGGGEAVRGCWLRRRDHLQLETGRARRLPQARRHAQRPRPHDVRGLGAGVPRGRRVRGGHRLARRRAQVRRHLEVRQENLQRLARRLLRRARPSPARPSPAHCNPMSWRLQQHRHPRCSRAGDQAATGGCNRKPRLRPYVSQACASWPSTTSPSYRPWWTTP